MFYNEKAFKLELFEEQEVREPFKYVKSESFCGEKSGIAKEGWQEELDLCGNNVVRFSAKSFRSLAHLS